MILFSLILCCVLKFLKTASTRLFLYFPQMQRKYSLFQNWSTTHRHDLILVFTYFYSMAATLNSTKFAVIMAKNSMVYNGVLFEDFFDNYLRRKKHFNFPISVFPLHWWYCKARRAYFYTNKSWHFKCSISSMIKLSVVKYFRKLSYDKTISSLTDEEAILLYFLMKTVKLNLLAV